MRRESRILPNSDAALLWVEFVSPRESSLSHQWIPRRQIVGVSRESGAFCADMGSDRSVYTREIISKEGRMQYVNLGRTALKVSRLCLGTMNFGPQTSEADSYAIMDKALDLGINFFDTANVYGWKKGEGVTEQIVGRWWAQGGGRREKVVIATKVYGDMGDWPNTSRLSALHIRQACEASLRRLKTDFIDLYQFHHVWREATWDEIWEAMELLVQQGKVLYVGSSNFAGWHIVQANEAAKKRNFLGLVSEQSLYHLLNRNIEREVIPACQAYGVGLIPWSPLQGGLLAGALGGVRGKATEGRRA